MPPTIGGMTLPYESGQSGTARPDSVDVTSAPATRSRKTPNATPRVATLRIPALRVSSVSVSFVFSAFIPPRKSGSGLEREGDRLGLRRADRDLLRLRAELLVPRFDRVRAGRQVLDRIRAVRRRHREERVRDDTAVGGHPAVHVTLDADHDLWLVELLRVLHSLDGHPEVEGLVLLREGMDVVEGVVAVQDVEALSRDHAENVRMVCTTPLVDDGRGGGRRIRSGDPRLHVHEHVREALVGPDDDVFLRHVAGVLLRAEGVGRHLELLGGGHRPFEDDPAGDRGGARGAGGGAGGGTGGRSRRNRGLGGALRRGTLGARGLGLVLVVVLAATAGGKDDDEDKPKSARAKGAATEGAAQPAVPAASAAGSAAGPAAGATGSASITGRIVFEGAVPAAEKFKMSADAFCAKQHPGDVAKEDVVIGPDKGLANVFVYVKSGITGTYPPPAAAAVIDQRGCTYHPHVFGMVAGQSLDILNSDDTLHNIHSLPEKNESFK